MTENQHKLNGWIVLFIVLHCIGSAIGVVLSLQFMFAFPDDEGEGVLIGLVFLFLTALTLYFYVYRLIYKRNKLTLTLVRVLLGISVVLGVFSVIGAYSYSIQSIGQNVTYLFIETFWFLYFMFSKRAKQIYMNIPNIANNKDY